MTGRNWARLSSRNRTQRQGVDELRGQAAAAFLAWREGQKAKDK